MSLILALSSESPYRIRVLRGDLEVGEAIFVKSFDPNGRLVLGIRLRSFLDASPFEIYFPTLERFDEALLAEKRLLSMIQKIKGLPT